MSHFQCKVLRTGMRFPYAKSFFRPLVHLEVKDCRAAKWEQPWSQKSLLGRKSCQRAASPTLDLTWIKNNPLLCNIIEMGAVSIDWPDDLSASFSTLASHLHQLSPNFCSSLNFSINLSFSRTPFLTQQIDRLQWLSSGGNLGLHPIPGAWEAPTPNRIVSLRPLLD